MFSKILVANRGEIALRVIRACREMGIETVAVYSQGDEGGLHAQLADDSVCIGPAPARDSYLNMHAVLSATVATGAQAIHPGYGFLSENSVFAAMCERCNIAFIGPDAGSMERMGNKINARETMLDAGVPVIPGSRGILTGIDEARKVAGETGYPVMIKAAAGGGGRGIRKINSPAELDSAYHTAKVEAKASFNNDGLYLEKCIENARHVEFQLLCDNHGNAVHLYERDCSLQRRNQKVLEESPCTAINGELREKMGADAVRVAKMIGYHNVGTMEFLLDQSGSYFFMEMNTRIQVEHPVTEMVTGIDLIKWQIRTAAGEHIPFRQEDISLRGHAIECRLNAEDAQTLRPVSGEVTMLHIPGGPGVRFDSLLYPGYHVPPFYDNMIGKLIAHGDNRKDAIAKMRSALAELVIDGIATNADFQMELLESRPFEVGRYDTGTIARLMEWS